MVRSTLIFCFLASLAATVTADDEPVAAILDRGNAALSKGRTSDALTIFSSAIEKDNRNYMTYFKRATTYLAMSRHSAALSDFDKVLSLKPDFSAAIQQRGRVMSTLGRWDAALSDFEKVGESSNSLHDIENARKAAQEAESSYASGAAEKCVEKAIDAITVASASSSLRLLRARCHVLQGQTEEAIGDLIFATKLNPADPGVQILLANLFFFALDDNDRAIGQLKTCLHYDPDAKSCKRSFRSLKKLSKLRAAITKSRDAKSWISAKKALMGAGEDAGLLTLVKEEREHLIAEGVLSERLHLVLSASMDELACQILGETKDSSAMKYCEAALQANPNSVDAIVTKANLLVRAEDYQGAINILQKANEETGNQDQRLQGALQDAQRALKVSKQKNYYQVLGVDRSADTKTIKKAYRKLTKEFHPDKYRGDLSSEQVVKKIEGINEAYEVLTTPELRARFDNGDDPNAPPDQNHNPFAHHGFHQGGHQQFFQQAGGNMFGGFGGGAGSHTFKFSF